jgi:hypothetical protein
MNPIISLTERITERTELFLVSPLTKSHCIIKYNVYCPVSEVYLIYLLQVFW